MTKNTAAVTETLAVVYTPIDLINPAEYNPRTQSDKEYSDLKESITRFGIVDPFIVNSHETRKNVLIGGHFRLRVARDLGYTEVPVVYVSIDSIEKEKELNLRLNKNTGAWDYNLLALFGEDLLSDVGFDSADLDKIFPAKEKPHDDDVPEITEPVSQRGDIYILGDHRLMCGDSTDEKDVNALMGKAVAQMVFTDPPYNVDYGSSKNPRHKIRHIKNDKQTKDQWETFCKTLAVTIKKHCLGDVYVWGASGPDGMKMRLWFIEAGMHWSATIVWKKQQLVLSPAKYQRMYEPCLYGWFDKSSFSGDRKQTEVWEINRPLNSKLHPTMKPVELCEKAIINSSEREAIVLDLFIGAGSTIIACEKTGRICYGMEIDPVYVDTTVKRWEEYTGKKAVKVVENG